jgi:farnesyl diphosphate synthase
VKDSQSVAVIKDIFRQLDLPKLYSEYEESSYVEINRLINELPDLLPSAIFHGFMAKIYKRKM